MRACKPAARRMYTSHMMTRVRSARHWAIGIALFVAVLLAGKAVSLSMLSGAVDTHTAAISAFYQSSIGTHVPALLESRGVGTRERNALQLLLDRAAALDGTADAIVQTQQAFENARTAISPTLRNRQAFKDLEMALSKGGTVQPLLDIHNMTAQQWNNQEYGLLGSIFVRTLRLKPQLLLQADGKVEYETTITF
jgi:hypothetical protein